MTTRPLLSQIVTRTAERFPDREAFRCSGTPLTYADLDRRTSQLAHGLRELGVARGDRVGIFLRKGLDAAVALHGILKSGAAYVPIDPAIPADRLAFILRDCGIRHLITESAHLRVIAAAVTVAPELRPILIGIPPDTEGDIALPIPASEKADGSKPLTAYGWDAFDALPTGPPDSGVTERDMAYLMYTSGSTGTPKGIMHTHESGMSYAAQARDTYDVTPEDRLSNFPPLHFDQSTFDYFSGPLAGAVTVVIPEAYTKVPASLSQLIQDERLTIWYSVPFALIQLLNHGVLEERELSSLRWVKFGGEPFPPKYLRQLQALLPNARFSNVYGPAEVNQCTYYHAPRLSPGDDGPLPIGRLWEGAEGLVVDSGDREVAPGEPGELLVRTPTMMRGYWNRPDLNARAFHDRTAEDGSVERYYRTGDLVRARTDGVLEFVGRADRQIKTRGYRVELDEVEAAVLSYDGVAEAAVFDVPDPSGTNRIEAALIPNVGSEVDLAGLRRHLSARLPGYAVPTAITVAETLPRTSNEKIDRPALARAAARAVEDARTTDTTGATRGA